MERMERMKRMKRKTLILGALPLCALIIGALFALNRVSPPVHADTIIEQCGNTMDRDVVVCIDRHQTGTILTTNYSLFCDSKNTAGTATIRESRSGQELNSWSKSYPCGQNLQGPSVAVPDRGVDYSFGMDVLFANGNGEGARTPAV